MLYKYDHDEFIILTKHKQKHRKNDMLNTTSNKTLNRRFIITEGLFHNHGDIVDLKRLIKLK